MVDRIGQQLGNYRLVRELGQGGFAEVYLGEHIYLKSLSAIKFLRGKVISQADLDAFLREAQTIARLVHPNIIRVTDFGVVEEIPFLVMDYAPNGTLRQRHQVGKKLPLNVIIPYVRQVADALQHAHDERIIHRDIKPENMLVGRRDEILLSDFGIALIAQSTHSLTMQDMVGTAAYMAPEQIQGRPRPASDQYALGIVVYEWLSGIRPFHGSFTELCAQHILAPPPPLYERVPAIAPEIAQVVMTALEKDFRQRFASVKAFATALEQAYQGTGPQLVLRQPSSSSPGFPTVADVKSPGEAETVLVDKERLSSGGKGSLSSDDLQVAGTLQTPQIVSSDKSKRYSEGGKQGISRRAAVIGLVGGSIAVVGGGSAAVWLLRSTAAHTLPTPSASPTNPKQSDTIYIYRGHTLPVTSTTWSPDGKRIASASRDTTVQVWDAFDGRQAFIYQGHGNIVWSVSWSPNGRYIVSASHDRTAHVWDAITGNRVSIYLGHKDIVWGAAWSPDSKYVASGSLDKTVQVWEAATGRQLYTYHDHTDAVRALAWSPSGTRIVSASWDKTVQVWDAFNGQHPFIYRGHHDRLTTVAWSPDGTLIASGSNDRTVQVWNATDGSHPFIYYGNIDKVNLLAWSPSNLRVASASKNEVKLWDVADGGHSFLFQGHTKGVAAVAWSHDGRYIASGGDDQTVQVWKAR